MDTTCSLLGISCKCSVADCLTIGILNEKKTHNNVGIASMCAPLETYPALVVAVEFLAAGDGFGTDRLNMTEHN